MTSHYSTPARGFFSRILSTAGILLCSWVATVSAQTTTTVVNDTFADGERKASTPPASAAWLVAGGATTTLAASTSGMVFTTGGATGQFLANIPTITLANPGDTVTFTFDFTPSADVPYVAIGLRAALLNSNGATKLTDDGTALAIGNYQGYAGFKTSQITQTDASASIKKRLGTATATGELIGSTSNVWTSNAFNPTTEAASPAVPVRFQFLAGKTYTGTITVTKVDATTNTIQNTWSGNGSTDDMLAHDNGTGNSTANSAPPVTTFDTVAFGAVGAALPSGTTLTFTKLTVTTNTTVSGLASAPTITTQPQSASVTAGGSATFTVVATGTPTPTYQWNKGGAAISGATNATYSITAAAASDAGSYTVIVTNSAGAVTSSAATLTVSAASTAPTISTQPANVTVTAGASATFTVVATGSPTPTYQWKKAGTAISGATSATYTIAATAAADAGSYAVTVSNSAGSVDSSAATLTVNPAGGGNVAPTITTQPTSVTVTAGAPATFTVAASGTPAPTYQWSKGATAVASATGASYTIAATTAADAGNYSVTATNVAGSVTSTGVTLTVNAAGSGNVAPAITTQPSAQTITVGGSATFTVVATGTPTPTYQWTKNGGAISGATNASLTIANAATTDAGTYAVVVSNSVGSATSTGAALTVNPALPVSARLVNISGRANIGIGNNALIVGTSWNGGAKPVVFRLAGPALKTFGLSTAITAPRLQLMTNGILTTTNTGWDGTTASSTSFAQVGAFPFAAGSKDAAIINTFPAGSYVLIASNVDGVSGAGLGEIYDASTTASLSDRILNVSVRAQVGSGDNVLITGFIISGTGSMPVVIRGIGPALNAYGLTGLTDPKLTLSGVLPSSPTVSTSWDSSMTAMFAKVGAFPLTAGSKDAAIVTTLPPGAYTVTLSSVSGGSGSGLIEVYDAQ
jgi:hypothetical protein